MNDALYHAAAPPSGLSMRRKPPVGTNPNEVRQPNTSDTSTILAPTVRSRTNLTRSTEELMAIAKVF